MWPILNALTRVIWTQRKKTTSLRRHIIDVSRLLVMITEKEPLVSRFRSSPATLVLSLMMPLCDETCSMKQPADARDVVPHRKTGGGEG